MSEKFTALMILDGFGMRAEKEGNAVILGDTPNIDALMKEYPTTSIGASGESVGLPDGQMGNSEVGHLNIGAGRIVYQELTRITKSIKDGDFFTNEALTGAVEYAKAHDSSLHLMGLVSDGGVHSHLDHLCALVELGKRRRAGKNLYSLLYGRQRCSAGQRQGLYRRTGKTPCGNRCRRDCNGIGTLLCNGQGQSLGS